MPRMTAVTDRVTWTEWDERLRRMEHKTLRRDETADVPDEVIARIEQIQKKEVEDHLAGRVIDHRAGHARLVPEEEYDDYRSTAAAAADPLNRFSDDDIRTWDTDTAVAHMNQLPGIAQRVLDLEEERKPRRRAVTAHAQRLIDATKGSDVSLAPADTVPSPAPLLPAEES
jgi:hypothetical protein